jgi:peptide/nickel transport system permease protein
MAQLTKKSSLWRDAWQRLYRNKLGMLGLIILGILVILIVGADVFSTHDYARQDYTARFAMPSREHIMGADNYGRDLWSRLLHGGRISLLISLCSVIASVSCGAFLGSTAAYFGGKTDLAITRLLDALMAIPNLLLAVAISAALGTGPDKTIMAISISGIPGSMRIMRATVLSVKSNDFVEAARATGSRHFRIIFKHIFPNTIAPLVVNSTLQIGGNIMAISGLSFIGLGVQAPIAEWGAILSSGRQYIRDFWPLIVFPALFIFLTVFSVNLLGDGLRDALDPRLKD